ncbi:hypothetical protein GE107_20205 [Cohnella sp. CFH 77786]|uniref:right-handed parallel beta-helix repeat-containing protein n=1 Tax=Cohnella sp. CFH 77786 TaxID=2662265 RepID=UPI001C609E62|nr:right-handed parallel beta-helix repeat-containing protein [Cohnella sp. CFH 77786]MBW5448370.1 hypothetical protein [Cohnella sp. CFH 77786]
MAPNPNSYLNVKTDFGAVGDGSTDDTAAVRNAIGEAIRMGGATVYVPHGTYKISGIEVTGSFSLVGDGESSVLFSDDRTRSVLKINNAAGSVWRSFKIKSTAAGDYTKRNPLLNGLFLFRVERCTADELFVENTYGAGILVSGCTGSSIERCSVRNTLADGIHVTGRSKDCIIARNTLTDTGDDGIAVVSYQSDQDLCERILITGNHVVRSWSRGIAHIGGRSVTISDNLIQATAVTGILVEEDTNYSTYQSYDTIIHHNQIVQAGTYVTPRPITGNRFGVEIASGAIGVRVDGNTVKESQTIGLAVTGGTSGVEIRGNRIFLNRGSGVQLSDTDKILFFGNTVESNVKYGLFAARIAYGVFAGNQWLNNNFFDIDSPGTGTPSPDVQAIDNANFYQCSDCVIADNVSVDDRTDRARARVERAIEITGSRRIKVGGNRCFVYNADPGKAIATESFLSNNQDCERMDLFAGSGVPNSTVYRAGQFYFRTDTKEQYVYDGAAWRKIALT